MPTTGGSPTSGRATPTRTNCVLGDRPVLRQVQQVQERPTGVRRPQSGAYLHRSSWTSIVRHPMVKLGASPDDPALADYWPRRRSKAPPLSIDAASLRLFEDQHGRCQICGDWLLSDNDRPQSPREWERWQLAARKTIITIATRVDGTPDDTTARLAHAHCIGEHDASRRDRPSTLHAREPPGLA